MYKINLRKHLALRDDLRYKYTHYHIPELKKIEYITRVSTKDGINDTNTRDRVRES